jgi:predicted dehydrogenase
MKDKISIGILSFAHGHSGVYCQVIKDFADAQVLSAWDANPERGQANASKYDLELLPRPEDIVNDPRIDAVIITCETNRHADMVELAAAAGKHILLQKPMATTLEDCDRIIRAVDQAGVKFSMAFQMRHDPVNKKIKELLQAGAVGKVAVVRRRHSLGVLLDPNFVNGPSKWHIDPTANVGMFFDEAAHTNDWFYWLLGQPRSVMAEIDNVVTHSAPDDNGVAIYRFQNGEIGELQQSATTIAAIATTEIYGDEGTIVQDYGDGPSAGTPRPDNASALRLIRKGEKQWTDFGMYIPKSQGERLMNIPRPFVDYIRGLTDQTISAREGRVSIEMSVGAYRSAAEGRRILLPL